MDLMVNDSALFKIINLGFHATEESMCATIVVEC
jgi:hypothetical protein